MNKTKKHYTEADINKFLPKGWKAKALNSVTFRITKKEQFAGDETHSFIYSPSTPCTEVELIQGLVYCAHYGGTEHGKNKAVENPKNKIAKMIFD